MAPPSHEEILAKSMRAFRGRILANALHDHRQIDPRTTIALQRSGFLLTAKPTSESEVPPEVFTQEDHASRVNVAPGPLLFFQADPTSRTVVEVVDQLLSFSAVHRVAALEYFRKL